MKKEILKLKKLNAAYIAALEYDNCPDESELESIKDLYDVGINDNDFRDALSDNCGRRPDEIAGEMSSIIKKIKH